MRIVFVRHGHPNYELDCLTELGHKHAEAAALRLKNEKIEKIYSSTSGRAFETAIHTANVLKIPQSEIVPCNFIREVKWSSFDETPIYNNGNPWDIAILWSKNGKDITDRFWQEKEPFIHSRLVESEKNISRDIDLWLEGFGYKREGKYYRITKENDSTVAMFSHCGSSSLAIAHMFNIPALQFMYMMPFDFTAITVVSFTGEMGGLTSPQFEILGDGRHISGIE